MATHASRDTRTGLIFEEKVHMEEVGENISKHALYRFLANKDINWNNYLSKKLLPDEAYYDAENNKVIIYEKNISKPQALLMKNLKLVLLKFISFVNYLRLLVSQMFNIFIFLMNGLKT